MNILKVKPEIINAALLFSIIKTIPNNKRTTYKLIFF